jgi:glutathione synthase/RimK-type ligase-like ATP-grasp enzyme
MNLYFLPYHMGITSVKDLQNMIGGWQIKKEGSTYDYSKDDLIVNWGRSWAPPWGYKVPAKNILNHWSKLGNAIDKIQSFVLFTKAGVPTPDWTTSKSEALSWIKGGSKVFCRTKTTSFEGRGIVVATKPSELVDAPLYTKLFNTYQEYRCHVFNGKVIDFTQKKLRNGYKEIPNRGEYVRSWANGWIFARQGVVLPKGMEEIAIAATKAVGLDFGAVDLAVDAKGNVVVFEINTAPGIEGTTLKKYAEAITAYKTKLEKQ